MPKPFTAASVAIAVALLLVGVTGFTKAADVTIGPRTLHVADGFEVELVAGPPLVERPIAVAADERGRLYVTDSGGMSEKAERQLELKPHRVRRLEDVDGDGRFDKSVLFADRLMFPEGCLWRDGSLYVAAPPQIWKLTDADGDGAADRRDVWYDGKTLTGCGNDLHGPYLGRDGWLYWCKGAFAEQRLTLPNGKPFVTRASHVFRARPDGTGVEPVLTGGMDNPVNVAFLSTGERILSCTFFQQPAAGRRDGLIHAVYGGVYGKRQPAIDGHTMTGDLMPVLSHQGAAAPCGLVAASAALWGGGYEDHLLACYFNLHKVVRHELVPDGATFKTTYVDLLSSDHPDFHPTDVFEDADGSLLVVDTGGWYKVCCPTSVLAKPDVFGAIYRVRKTGAPRVQDPRGTTLKWEGASPVVLASRLTDRRPFVRRWAVEQLRKTGADGATVLADRLQAGGADVAVRREILWATAGIDAPAARAVARGLLADLDPAVRHAAAHAAGLWRDRDAVDPLRKLVADPADPALVRAAAEALGRVGDPRAVPTLLAAIEAAGPFVPDATGAPAANGAPGTGGLSGTAGTSDLTGTPGGDARRILEHSLIYALIEIGDPASVAPALSSASPRVRRAALVALDQMGDEAAAAALKPAQVVPLLNEGDPILRNTATWVVGHRPNWGPALVDHFRQRLVDVADGEAGRAELVGQLARLAGSPAVRSLLADSLRDPPSPAGQIVALRAMAEAGLAAAPPAWLDELSGLLRVATTDPLRHQAVAAARALPRPKGGHAKLTEALVEVARRADVPADVRLAALQAAGPLAAVDDGLLADLVKLARPAEPPAVRRGAAAVLAAATLTAGQQGVLADSLREVGPLELPALLPAFERGAFAEEVGLKLVAALGSSSGRSGLRPGVLKPLLDRFPPAVREAGRDLLARSDPTAGEQAAHLDKLLSELPAGDARRGQEVFVGKKVGCVACHALGYQGGRLGPDLTSIGSVRTPRDLLEAIVYPSASFVRGYEPVVVTLLDGDRLAGIVTGEAKDDLTLATGPQEVRHLPRTDVAKVTPANLSLMPDGFEAALTKQELADLIAFLRGPGR